MYLQFSVFIVLSIITDIICFVIFALHLAYHSPFILFYAIGHICCLDLQMVHKARSHKSVCILVSILILTMPPFHVKQAQTLLRE